MKPSGFAENLTDFRANGRLNAKVYCLKIGWFGEIVVSHPVEFAQIIEKKPICCAIFTIFEP
jgi:hypothetical protein